MIRQGPARTRVEGLRQISRRLRLKADEFSQVAKAVPGMDALLKAAPAAFAPGWRVKNTISDRVPTRKGGPQVPAPLLV